MLIKKRRLELNMSQETVCKGICVVSYLSKIEKGSVQADNNIIKQLFGVLAIDYFTDVTEEASQVIYYILDSVIQSDIDLKELEKVRAEYSYLCYSPMAFVYMLLDFICKNYNQTNYNDVKELLQYESYADERELYYYYMLVGISYLENKYEVERAKKYFQKAHMLNPEGKGLFCLGMVYYNAGDYQLATDLFHKDFEREIEQGDISGAINCCLLLACSYSNMNSIALMLKYNNQALKLAKNSKYNIEYTVYYNNGSTYLQRDVLKALYYLKKAEAVCISQEELFYLYQKLVLAYQQTGDLEHAKEYLKKVSISLDKNHWNKDSFAVDVYQMLVEMLNNDNYRLSQDYGEIVRRLYLNGKQNKHYGFELFFGKYYIDWLKSNRRYKEALEITEKLYFLG